MTFNKLEKFFTNITLLATLIAFIFIFHSRLSVALPVILIAGISYFFLKTKHEFKNFNLILFGLSLLITTGFALIINTPPISDFKLILEASQSLLEGDTSFNQTHYFSLWPYQSFWVIFQSAILFFWNSTLAIKLVSCVLLSITNVLIYNITCEYFSKKASMVMSIFHLFFLIHMSHVTVLSNNISSAFFMCLGLYILICKKLSSWHLVPRYAFAGVIFSIGNMLRPDGIVIILSLLAFTIVKICENPKQFKKSILSFITLFLSYTLVFNATASIISATGVHPDGLDNNNPLWKLVLGFNHDTGGGYTYDDMILIDEMQAEFDLSFDDAQIEIIKERVFVSPFKLFTLFEEKVDTFWSADSLFWSFGHLSQNFSTIYNYVVSYNIAFYSLTLFLAFLGFIYLALNKNIKSSKKCFLLFIILATFIAYLLIEVQPRYAFFLQFIIFIFAGGGIDFIFTHFKNPKSN